MNDTRQGHGRIRQEKGGGGAGGSTKGRGAQVDSSVISFNQFIRSYIHSYPRKGPGGKDDRTDVCDWVGSKSENVGRERNRNGGNLVAKKRGENMGSELDAVVLVFAFFVCFFVVLAHTDDVVRRRLAKQFV
jgi:hypothetical protein